MRQRRRWLALLVLGVCFQACDDSACGEILDPIPGGFPPAKRIENSVQFRLTPSGIAFLEDNVDRLIAAAVPEGLTFDIPESTADGGTVGNIIVGNVTICPGGGCSARVEVTALDIRPTPPSTLVVVLDLEIVTGNIRLSTARNAACAFLSGFECDVDFDTRRAPPSHNTISARVVFTIDSTTGYTALNVTEAGLVDGLQNDDIRIVPRNTCGEVWCRVANIGFVKDYLIDRVEEEIAETLEESLASLRCMRCPDRGCPAGSTCNEDDFCVRPDGECVPRLLGVEGQTDLGRAMASVSPGLSAKVQLLAVAGGYANVEGNGLNLGFWGGFEGPSVNPCVPAPSVGDYTPVARAPELASGDTFTRCKRCPTGTECSAGYTCSPEGDCRDGRGACETVTEPVAVKLGVSEQLLNRALGAIFDSGALCVTVGTSVVKQLNSAALALLVPAIDVLTWDQKVPVAIELRPQRPPRVEIGEIPRLPDGTSMPDDTLLALYLEEAELDVYVWMFERYVRIFTVRMDLIVGLRLAVEDGKIVPSITAMATDDVEVRDAEIVGPPHNINEVFTDLLELAAAMIPPFEPIELPEFSGFKVQIVDGGITHLASGGEDFLAIYANFAIPAAPSPHTQTYARVTSLEEPPVASMLRRPVRLAEIVPTLTIDATARWPVPTDRAFDYRWRIDGGSWSPWTRNSRLVIRDAKLIFAGEHVVEVQSRLADDDRTIDRDPVRIELFVEGVVPMERTTRRPGPLRVGPAELRGRPEPQPDSPPSSGCECAVAAGGSRPLPLLPVLALGAILVLRRRRVLSKLAGSVSRPGVGAGVRPARSVPGPLADFCLFMVAVLAFAAASLLATGCGCPSKPGADIAGICTSDDQCLGGRCCPGTGQCVPLPSSEDFCPPGYGCLDDAGNFAPSWDSARCEYTTECCKELPPLPRGFVGWYSEIAVAPDGTIWVSGYSAGPSYRSPYGDLVAGIWNASTQTVDWEHVDGVPTGARPTGSLTGWRGGISRPGDDVGKYSAIAIGADSHPRIAYYDATNGALKYAARSASGWTVVEVDDQGDAGRYADLAIDREGRPVISYSAIEESTENPGAWVSKMKVAWATDQSGTSWNITEIESVGIPCWKELCGGNRVCVASTRRCVEAEPESACGSEGCPSGQECVEGSCVEVFDTAIDFPEGVGIGTAVDCLPSGEPLVVYYDRGSWDPVAREVRPHGNLKQAVWSGSGWTVSILDGAGTDAGWHPSLDVDDSGRRHVAYVDGIAEALIYLNPDAGIREVVDGRSMPGRMRSIVGDDSSIRVTASGDVWIAYQDATARTLRLAHRPPGGGWTIATYDTGTDSAGFFATLVLAPDGTTPVVSTYWHRTTASGTTTTRYSYESGVRVFVGPPSP